MPGYTIIGYQEKSGEFEGKPYHNMVFSSVRPADESRGEIGQVAFIFKIRMSDLSEVPDIGTVVYPYYDQYGRCIGFHTD